MPEAGPAGEGEDVGEDGRFDRLGAFEMVVEHGDEPADETFLLGRIDVAAEGGGEQRWHPEVPSAA
ncbi:Uncharacterised protein [Mycobacteroides abscessus subsp. abscessus]|nr:Uncharacterised protein [Mycobacteroides abscessus subsp. abscessus]